MSANGGEASAAVSLFSGIGGFDLGIERAGFRVLVQAESEPYRRDVLRARFPGARLHDDVCAVGEPAWRTAADGRSASVDERRREAGTGLPGGADLGDVRAVAREHRGAAEGGAVRPDLLFGGFPCQDLSVAGRRAGLAGSRSGLFFEFVRVAEALRPRAVLLENVPGLLSSNGGRDFGVVLGALADLGYGVGWRVLDSRFFGVPQRRRRVFILGVEPGGRAGAERAGEILAVGTRCARHPATGDKEGPDTSVASLSGLGSGGPDDNDAQGGRLVAGPLATGQTPKGHGMAGVNQRAVESNHVIAAPLTSGGHPNSNAPGQRKEDDENLAVIQGGSQQDQFVPPSAVVPTLAHSSNTHKGHHQPKLLDGATVRRLMPVECERLQGFPDGWTQLGDTADSPRYAALGDAVTVNVSEWLGHQLMQHIRAKAVA